MCSESSARLAAATKMLTAQKTVASNNERFINYPSRPIEQNKKRAVMARSRLSKAYYL